MNELVDYVGPWLSTEQTRELLRIDQSELMRRLTTRELLGVEFDDGTIRLPGRQFHDGQVVDGLHAVLDVLATGPFDADTWAIWMAGSPGDGITHWERLHAGSVEQVLTEARRDANRWSQ